MTIGTAYAHFRERLQALEEVVRQLALAIDDAPDGADEPAVVDSLRGETAEIEGEVAAAVRAAGEARPAACQRIVNRVWHALQREVASHHALAEVDRVAAERGGAWIRWSGVVRQAAEHCEQTVFEAADALAACWDEIVERDAVEISRA